MPKNWNSIGLKDLSCRPEDMKSLLAIFSQVTRTDVSLGNLVLRAKSLSSTNQLHQLKIKWSHFTIQRVVNIRQEQSRQTWLLPRLVFLKPELVPPISPRWGPSNRLERVKNLRAVAVVQNQNPNAILEIRSLQRRRIRREERNRSTFSVAVEIFFWDSVVWTTLCLIPSCLSILFSQVIKW